MDCPHCGNRILYRWFRRCPHCGAPNARRSTVHLWLLLLCLGASVWFLVWTHTGSEGNFPDWAAILWRLGADLVFAYFIIYVASYFLVALVIWSPRHCRHKKSRCDNYCRKCGRRMEPPETPSGSNPAVSARHI